MRGFQFFINIISFVTNRHKRTTQRLNIFTCRFESKENLKITQKYVYLNNYINVTSYNYLCIYKYCICFVSITRGTITP